MVVALLIELGLYRVKEFTLEDGGLLAGQDLALEHDLAGPVANTLGAGTTGHSGGAPARAAPAREGPSPVISRTPTSKVKYAQSHPNSYHARAPVSFTRPKSA